MATYSNSTTNRPPSSSSADDLILELLGEHAIRRSVVRISTEQRKLLDGDAAWSHDYCRRHKCFNVPAQVLQDLKTSHSRRIIEPEPSREEEDSISPKKQHNVASQGSSEKERDGSESVATPEHYDEPERRPNTYTNPGNEEDEDGDEDETKTQVSWATSDDEHMHPPQAQIQDGHDEFQTQVPLRSTPSDPSQVPPTLPPMPPPPPAIPDRSAANDIPSSSPGPEDELELEVPAALEVDVAPVNKGAQPGISSMLATPPSAQVVPCTYEPQELLVSPEREEKMKQKKKRPVYSKIPALYHPPKSAAATSLGTGMARMSPSKQAIIDTQSSSTTDTSSSIIPATSLPIPSRDRPGDVVDPLPGSSLNRPASSLESLAPLGPREPIEPQYNTSSLDGPIFSKPRQDSPVYVPPPSAKIPSSPPACTPAPGPEPVTQPAKQPEGPFIEFTIRYPQYTGSLNDFVVACTYLRKLAAKRRLRPYLFDDFVRAWSEGYRPYIRECDESNLPTTEVLTAIEWFNQLDGAPVFTKQILTVPELDRVLEFYPNEAPPSSKETHRIPGLAKPAEGATKGKEAAKSSLSTTTGSQSSLKSSAPSIDRGYRGSQGGASTVAEVLDEEPPQAGNFGLPQPPPPPPVPVPVPDRAQPTPARAPSKPMSEPPKRPSSTGLTRSLSEAASAPHKRKQPSADILLPPAKKASTGVGPRGAPRSPSGSSARSDESRATTMTAGGGSGSTRRRYADDEEKRRLMFGMFLKKNRPKDGRLGKRHYGEAGSVASSAPVNSNSTPTSGQKGQ